MKRYRLDPKKPRQLTPAEARRLGAAPIDYSDIPPLGDEFLRRQRPRGHRYEEQVAAPFAFHRGSAEEERPITWRVETSPSLAGAEAERVEDLPDVDMNRTILDSQHHALFA